MAKKNPLGRGRDAEHPYLTIRSGDWEYLVLKAYSLDPEKPFARWFCEVRSPMAPNGDLGDTYISSIKGTIVQRDPSVPIEALPRWLNDITPGAYAKASA